MSTFRDLVIRVAEKPTGKSHAAFCDALRTATVFVKLIGVPDPDVPGDKYAVPKGAQVRTRSVRLGQGMQMVRVSAAAPREVAPDEVIATMTGREALQMAMQMDGHGLIVAAEDERKSWTAITREGIAALLKAS